MRLRYSKKTGKSSKPGKSRFKNYFRYKRDYFKYSLKLWKKLRFANILLLVMELALIKRDESKEKVIECLKDILELSESEKVKFINKKFEMNVFKAIIFWIPYPNSLGGAEKMIDKLFEFAKSEDLRTLKHRKKVLSRFASLCRYSSFEDSINYLDSILKISRNRIKFKKGEVSNPAALLARVIEKYLQAVSKGEVDSLNDFQKIVKDLCVLMRQDELLFNPKTIFEGVSKDQFSTLCLKLSEENSELVEHVARRLFE